MADEWFYALGDQQKGPVTAAELLALEQAGTLRHDSLVWIEGMPNWQPWSEASSRARAAAGVDAVEGGMVRCAFSGRLLPKEQAVRYGERFVAIEHKDAFLQALREGRAPGLLPGSGEMEFIGFWWRVLASVIDWATKLVPQMLLMVPYYAIAVFGALGQAEPSSSDPLPGWSIAAIVAYAFGLIGTFALSVFYDTWMVGKYGGTVGKLALGFRVVNADGSPVTYMKAFGRWAAEVLEKLIATIIGYGLFAIGVVLAIASGFSFSNEKPEAGTIIVMIVGFVLAGLLGGFLGCFPWLMAGWTREKKALHDFMCNTRVIRRRQSIDGPGVSAAARHSR